MKVISFDRVKDILVSNTPGILHNVCGGSECSFASAAAALIGAMKSYVDGKPVRASRVASMMEDKVREFVRNADVRCLGDLLRLLPKGCDSRLPGWLYGPVDAQLEDGGWVLVPRAA